MVEELRKQIQTLLESYDAKGIFVERVIAYRNDDEGELFDVRIDYSEGIKFNK